MPTQEERLASLESFRTETLYAYKDMAYEMTIVKGLGEDSIKRLAAVQRDVSEIKATVNEQLKSIETAIQILSGNIMSMRTELLVIKALVQKEEE